MKKLIVAIAVVFVISLIGPGFTAASKMSVNKTVKEFVKHSPDKDKDKDKTKKDKKCKKDGKCDGKCSGKCDGKCDSKCKKSCEGKTSGGCGQGSTTKTNCVTTPNCAKKCPMSSGNTGKSCGGGKTEGTK